VATLEQYRKDLIEIFQNAQYPLGLTPGNAWLGVYQALLWHEPVNCAGFRELPHIIDSDKLRPPTRSRREGQINPSAWQRRAAAVNEYLAQNLGCTTDEVSSKTDLLMKHHNYIGMQRQNPLGIAFPCLIKHILERFGPDGISYESEVEADRYFTGVRLNGRSVAPRIDLLAKTDDLPRVIISAKWSVRHDRLNDITSECPIYKAAYSRIYRQARRESLLYFVITNEFDPARLNKIIIDNCIDGVVHVHKKAVTEICGMNNRLTMLIDLAEFIEFMNNW